MVLVPEPRHDHGPPVGPATEPVRSGRSESPERRLGEQGDRAPLNDAAQRVGMRSVLDRDTDHPKARQLTRHGLLDRLFGGRELGEAFAGRKARGASHVDATVKSAIGKGSAFNPGMSDAPPI